MASLILEFTRTYSFFEPTFTYNVQDLTANERIGSVARQAKRGRWWASNKTWTGGGDLVDTFPTRHDAANALWHIAHGTATPDLYGGYYVKPADDAELAAGQ